MKMEPKTKVVSEEEILANAVAAAKAAAEAAQKETAVDSLAFLRQAINSPDRIEVDMMIEKKISDFHCINKIELKKDDQTIVLPNEARHQLFPEIMAVVNAGIPAALIGPAGSGKSTACEQIAKALDSAFYLQSSVTGEHQLTGYKDAYGKYHGTPFRMAFEKGGLLLVDEVDTSDPSALKWMNTALANGYAMFPDSDVPVLRHKDFRIVIAANTFGNGADRVYVGANQLDASTLDRFVFFNFDYDEKMEVLLSGNPEWSRRVQALRRGARKARARIVISPRASIHGARLLKLGWKQNVVEDRTIWKNIDPELKERIVKEAA